MLNCGLNFCKTLLRAHAGLPWRLPVQAVWATCCWPGERRRQSSGSKGPRTAQGALCHDHVPLIGILDYLKPANKTACYIIIVDMHTICTCGYGKM